MKFSCYYCWDIYTFFEKLVFLDYYKQKYRKLWGTCVYRGVGNLSPGLEMKNHTFTFYWGLTFNTCVYWGDGNRSPDLEMKNHTIIFYWGLTFTCNTTYKTTNDKLSCFTTYSCKHGANSHQPKIFNFQSTATKQI